MTTGPATSRSTGNPRRNTAVAAVLGGDLHAKITRRPLAASSARVEGTVAGGDVDIEVLLRGAEKLCSVYPLPGALERIPVLRQRWANQSNTLAYYEAKVAEQAERLGRLNKRPDEFDEEKVEEEAVEVRIMDSQMTEEDVRREEEEVRELDKKKKELQERLKAMDKDLGGLLNM